MAKRFYVYIMASKINGTLYVGLTENLAKRAWEHRNEIIDGFSKKHGCKILVYFETVDDYEGALRREKRLKKWSREWKLEAINAMNPEWNDLYDSICQ
jgi:putative endonuclease